MRIGIILLILSVLGGIATLTLSGPGCGLRPIEECAPYLRIANLMWPVVAALGITSLVLFILGARMSDDPPVQRKKGRRR